MAYNDIAIEKKNKIRDFFQSNFGIDLESYTEEERVHLLEDLNSKLDKQLDLEMQRNYFLTMEYEKEKRRLDELLNNV